MSSAGRLTVGIIGAGKVGPVLGLAFAGAGHALAAITSSSRDEQNERLEALLPGVPRLDAAAVAKECDLLVFAIPGEELAQQVKGLDELGAFKQGQLLLHTAPAQGTEVFTEALRYGVIPLAVTPAITFTGTSLDLDRLRGAAIAVTAPAPVLPIAQALALELGGEPVVIKDADRPAYAEIIAGAREMAQLLTANAVRDLRQLGIDDPTRLIAPILDSAIAEQLRTTADGDPSDVPDIDGLEDSF